MVEAPKLVSCRREESGWRLTWSACRSARAGLDSVVVAAREERAAVVGREEGGGRALRVGLVCGGPSAERGISLNSARSVLDHIQVILLLFLGCSMFVKLLDNEIMLPYAIVSA